MFVCPTRQDKGMAWHGPTYTTAITYMQRMVHIRKKSIDEYMQVNGRMIKVIFTSLSFLKRFKQYNKNMMFTDVKIN